jgi:protein ECT2
MACRASLTITFAEFHLYLENPPVDEGDRWSGRPFRSMAVVRPPSPINLEPTKTEADKHRFLENLWNAQARYRTRLGQSVVLKSLDYEVEAKGSRLTVAQTFYNVYQRTAFLQEAKKASNIYSVRLFAYYPFQTKAVVHIDTSGSADDIPFGIGSSPFVVIRLKPLPGGLCRYRVTSSDPEDAGEEDIVQTGRVPSRIVLTSKLIPQYF